MRPNDVVVIDYGVGNLLSVRHSLEHCGAQVELSSDPEVILRAPRVVLPGVGAFSGGMAELCRRGLDAVALEVVSRGNLLLGICLGMQMLMDESEEFGLTAGLGLIHGEVTAIPRITADGKPHKVPHIGWNELVPARDCNEWTDTALCQSSPGDAVYFVHSFMAQPTNPSHRIADCLYGGHRVAAVIGRDNVMGCQFHPEKSGEAGLKILKSFLSL